VRAKPVDGPSEVRRRRRCCGSRYSKDPTKRIDQSR
jgi:hypothetical protein